MATTDTLTQAQNTGGLWLCGNQPLFSRIFHYENSFLKFCRYLLKAFWVDLKTCLGLVLPNQIVLYRQMGELRLVFGGYSVVGHAHTCMVPTIVLYDTAVGEKTHLGAR